MRGGVARGRGDCTDIYSILNNLSSNRLVMLTIVPVVMFEFLTVIHCNPAGITITLKRFGITTKIFLV